MADHVPFEVLVLGFENARARFHTSTPGGPESFHAILETLAWVGVLRDRLRANGEGVPAALNGLYYVRNLVLHQGADVLDFVIIHGTTLGDWILGVGVLGVPTSRGSWWPARDELPDGLSKTGASDYDTHVAGREVSEVLDELSRSLAPNEPSP